MNKLALSPVANDKISKTIFKIDTFTNKSLGEAFPISPSLKKLIKISGYIRRY